MVETAAQQRFTPCCCSRRTSITVGPAPRTVVGQRQAAAHATATELLAKLEAFIRDPSAATAAGAMRQCASVVFAGKLALASCHVYKTQKPGTETAPPCYPIQNPRLPPNPSHPRFQFHPRPETPR